MQRPISLTLRLNIFFGIAAIIVFSSFGWFIERSIGQHFSAGDAEELEVIAKAVSKAIKSHPNTSNETQLKQRFNDFLIGHHSAILQVTRADKSILFISHENFYLPSFLPLNPQTNRAMVQRWSNGKNNYRVLSLNINNGSTKKPGIIATVAMPIDYHLSFLHNFRYALWSMIASGIIVMGIIGWIAVRQGHAPLHNIISQIRRIHANELNTRLDPNSVPHELHDLALSFNDMLARMEEDFQRLTNFSADIAHELRTPVTALLTQTQVALSQTRSNDEYQEILYSNIEEYERMAQMIGDMLFLAQTDNRLYEINSVDIDLAEEVKSLFEYYEAWAEENGITLSMLGNAKIKGDRLMIRRVIGNLLSNAIKHTEANKNITIIITIKDNDVTLCVENPGDTIAEEHIQKLFDRFYRVDASRKRSGDSTGLGLSIAKSIIEIHNGKIDVSSKNNVTKFCIKLPALNYDLEH